MKKTLGGDRLGSGKKIEVDLHNYSRSTHDLGYIFRTTMSAGTLVPFMAEVALPGDTFDINLDCDVKTHPTVGPLFGGFKVQIDIFEAPIRLYQGALHNNKLGIGLNMAQIKLPIYKLMADPVPVSDLFTFETDIDNMQINPSSIFAYLGVRGIGIVPEGGDSVEREFNGVSWIAYWDIYKNYYANKQEEIGAVIHTGPENVQNNITQIQIGSQGNPGTVLPASPGVGALVLTNGTIITVTTTASQSINQYGIQTTAGFIPANQLGEVVDQTALVTYITYDHARWGTRQTVNWAYLDARSFPEGPIQVQTFSLSDIDAMREAILAAAATPGAFNINSSAGGGAALSPWDFALQGSSSTFWSRKNSQEGLAVKTYQSDMLNNWLQTEWIDGAGGINDITAIDTSSGSFNIDTLLLSRKVYDMLNRIAVSGGSYDDWMDAVYTQERYTRCESPMYHGGLIKELIFQEVVSNTESGAGNEGTQPLGTLAGKGVMGRKHKGGSVTVKVQEPSYIIGIISLTPRIDYSQGNQWDVHLKTVDDLHKPALDEIGFQELITEQMAWWDTFYDTTAGEWVQRSAGKQPAWLNYMTNINRVRGNFAVNTSAGEGFMILNRKYTPAADNDVLTIDDVTTYIDPAKYNNIFAQTSLDSQNFWVQIAADITARRKISAKIMPNL